MRDFFGKVIPGLILISVLTLCIGLQFDKLSLLAETVQKLSIGGGLVIFGLAWIVAFALQSFGESKRLIIYYPKRMFDDDESAYKFLNSFTRKASDNERIQVERLVVIKEACGNGYVSLILSLYLVAFYAVLGLVLRLFEVDQLANFALFTLGNLPLILIGLAFWIFMICYLKKMHFIHVERQHNFMKEVLDRQNDSGSWLDY